jgi:phage terminase large subunit GpA-like protein
MPQNTIDCIKIKTGSTSWLPPSLLGGAPLKHFSFTIPERRICRKQRKIPPSKWVEKYRVLTMSSLPGKWRNEVTPYLPGIMDASFFPSVETIILCKPPQTGGSEAVNNCVGYAADRMPGPVLYVYPDELTAQENCRDRIKPMFTASRKLRELLTEVSADLTNYRINLGHMPIYMAWARSVARLANKPIRYLIFDETDKYQAVVSKREADSIALGEIRTTTYRYNRKIWKISSPSIETGFIWVALTTEAQVIFDYWVHCPHCGAEQLMSFDQIKWPPKQENEEWDPELIKAESLAWYECPHCGAKWDDSVRDQAVRMGEWKARDDGRELFVYLEAVRPKKIGFHWPSWISTFVSLSDPVADFLKGQKDKIQLRNFMNKHKAEPWTYDVMVTSEAKILDARCALPQQTVPQKAICLTAGIDVQKYGFWFVVRAWARDYTRWLIHYGMLSTWEDLENLLFATEYPVQDMEGETMRILRAAIDTGGGEKYQDMSMTEETYWWLRRNGIGRGCRVWGTKGSSRPLAGKIHLGKALDKTPSGKAIPGGLQIVSLDTAKLKEALHYSLEQAAEQGPMAGYLHAETDQHYAKQILAEKKRIDQKGIETWVQIRRDNHLLDCECLAMAVADPEWPTGGIHLLRGKTFSIAKEKEKVVQPAERQDRRQAIRNFRRPSWLGKR